MDHADAGENDFYDATGGAGQNAQRGTKERKLFAYAQDKLLQLAGKFKATIASCSRRLWSSL